MEWLQTHFPDRSGKVENLIRSMRGGELGNSEFGKRMRGSGNYALNLKRQFTLAYNKFFPQKTYPQLNTELFRHPPKNGQLSLF